VELIWRIRLDEGIWNRVWAFTDDGRPLELGKLDVAVVPRVRTSNPRKTNLSLHVLPPLVSPLSLPWTVSPNSSPI
jgi:hypothetical protein